MASFKRRKTTYHLHIAAFERPHIWPFIRQVMSKGQQVKSKPFLERRNLEKWLIVVVDTIHFCTALTL